MASSGQDNSTISFSDGEGYKLHGFHSDTTSSDSTRTIYDAWIMGENENPDENQGLEQQSMLPPLSHSQPFIHRQQFSPSNFLVSDIEESDIISDEDIIKHSTSLSSPALKETKPGSIIISFQLRNWFFLR